MADGLGGEEVVAVSGTQINVANRSAYFTGSVTTESNVSGGNLFLGGSIEVAGPISNSVGAVGNVGTGSPTDFGHYTQAGSDATDAGSLVWTVFGTAFGGVPTSVVATSAETNEAILVEAGSVNAGSFYTETISASQTFFWNAVGPA